MAVIICNLLHDYACKVNQVTVMERAELVLLPFLLCMWMESGGLLQVDQLHDLTALSRSIRVHLLISPPTTLHRPLGLN